jgi:hypothetical protein
LCITPYLSLAPPVRRVNFDIEAFLSHIAVNAMLRGINAMLS